MEDNIPFTKSHVLKVTSNHVHRSIDSSIRKSFDRLKDRPDKNLEIIETIDILYKWKKINEDFMTQNPQLFNPTGE